ncbi:unnamed protein product [Danaus chrysippus]|uniref:(African queen) hypothetical protein n=1 Tax=Danaus chrysippus TaxID=151541 RepID=A0A8J2QNY4_9NEOP|nr:unnamed protein product [Danaus chrysippus]
MPLDYSNPAVITFLKENYERENEDRILWFMKNKEKIISSTTLSNTSKDYRTEDIARALIEPLMQNLAVHHKVSFKNRRRKLPHDNPVILDSRRRDMITLSNNETQKTFLTSNMKPVDPSLSNILRIEPPYGGRLKYLGKRYEIIPEEKYYFSETSNNIFGWRLKESEIGFSASDHKRKDLFSKDLKCRSGPHPDPSHYSEIQEFSKCYN